MSEPDAATYHDSGENNTEAAQFESFVRYLCDSYGEGDSEDVCLTLDPGDDRLSVLLEWLYARHMIKGPYQLPVTQRNFSYATTQPPYDWAYVRGINSLTMPSKPARVMILGSKWPNPTIGFQLSYTQYIEPTSMFLFEQRFTVSTVGGNFASTITFDCWRAFNSSIQDVAKAGGTTEMPVKDAVEFRDVVSAALKIAK